MKIRVMSDLHLEFGPLDLEYLHEDVLLLAGDVGVGMQGVRWAADYVDRTGVKVVMVLGNHEFYGSSMADIRRAIAAERVDGVSVLDDNAVFVGGVWFIGGTLWTDFKLNGEEVELASKWIAAKEMNDHRYIWDFTPDEAQHEHWRTVDFLRSNLVDPPPRTVVVTHHLPSSRSLDDRYCRTDRDRILNGSFASHLDDLVEGSGAILWVHGHTHASKEYTIGGTIVLCNPRGYFPYDLNPDFNPNMIVYVDARPC